MISRPSGLLPAVRPTATWVVDRGGILAIEAGSGDAHWLRGTEAAVWSWLSAGHSHSELAVLLAAYLAIDTEDAAARLDAILRSWWEAGLVAMSDPAHG